MNGSHMEWREDTSGQAGSQRTVGLLGQRHQTQRGKVAPTRATEATGVGCGSPFTDDTQATHFLCHGFQLGRLLWHRRNPE